MLTPLLILWLAAATPLELAERAVMEGQSALQQERWADAARLFQEGVQAAEQIGDEATRTQALAAMHFFSALALSSLGEESRAREQIERFLVYSPSTKSVDEAQYPAAFVAAFDEVAKTIRSVRPSEFDRRYPGFRWFSAETPAPVSVALWADSPEAKYLATAAEMAEFNSLATDAAREAFIAEFWKRRDPTPASAENEFRTAFDARVVFADRNFAGEHGERGSLTDRGRVLVLLGRPRDVMYEKNDSTTETEIWGYDREQLPVRIRDRSALFRFVDDITRFYAMPPSAEADRILTAAAAKAARK